MPLEPEILVYRVREKFDQDGRLTDQKTRELVARLLTPLVEWIDTFSRCT